MWVCSGMFAIKKTPPGIAQLQVFASVHSHTPAITTKSQAWLWSRTREKVRKSEAVAVAIINPVWGVQSHANLPALCASSIESDRNAGTVHGNVTGPSLVGPPQHPHPPNTHILTKCNRSLHMHIHTGSLQRYLAFGDRPRAVFTYTLRLPHVRSLNHIQGLSVSPSQKWWFMSSSWIGLCLASKGSSQISCS